MTMTDPDKPRPPVQWLISDKPVGYDAAVTFMETRIGEIRARKSPELIWLLEHPALYTAGTSARARDLLTPDRFPVHNTGRGGQYTYHGPGQRVIYVMLDVKRRGADVRAFVTALETWLIDVLATFNVIGATHADRVGVWVRRPGRPDANRSPISLQSPHDKNSPPLSVSDDSSFTEDKIGAIGIRLRKWVSYHGMSLNVDPCLDHFGGIVPCGITDHGVTSLKELGICASMEDVDQAIRTSFERRFGPIGTLLDLQSAAQQRRKT